MTTHTPFPFEHATPPAAAMLESLRGMGYTLETAIADLIDNSIAAGARRMWIQLHWAGQDSYITLLDDGLGMIEAELRQAMRPGSRNPRDPRAKDDLGRFGLGLKTASFSQCRSLTVLTRQRGDLPYVRRWDLDHVSRTDDWQLLLDCRPGSEARLSPLDPLEQGTLVIWEQLDRLVGDAKVDDNRAQTSFLKTIDHLREHLGMVFHRYLEPGFQSLRIFINGHDEAHRVTPWDPFLQDEAATIPSPEEPLWTEHGEVKFQGFVLPHPDRLKRPELLERGGGMEGWTSQQGFYVYRNRRLLAWGTWLGIGDGRRWRKDELHKLARIRLDIPNSADEEWKIDIRKSSASPPVELRARLRDLARNIRDQAAKVFRHRGQYGARAAASEHVRLWEALERQDVTVYRISRRHPVVKDTLERAAQAGIGLEPLLQAIEQSVPIQRIWVDVSSKGEAAVRPLANAPDELLDLARTLLRQYVRSYNDTPDQARARLLTIEPFSAYPDHIRNLSPGE